MLTTNYAAAAAAGVATLHTPGGPGPHAQYADVRCIPSFATGFADRCRKVVFDNCATAIFRLCNALAGDTNKPKCKDCVNGEVRETCSFCSGGGCNQCSPPGSGKVWNTCKKCDGKGYL